MVVSHVTSLGIGAITFAGLCLHWYLQGLRRVRYTPGYRVLLEPYSIASAVLPRTFWNFGANWAWLDRKTSFFNYTHDIISIVPILTGKAGYYTCSIDVMKQLLGNEGKLGLVKPLELTLHPLLGDNIASSSGEIWRKHRRAVAPAFNAKTYAAVGFEVVNVYNEIVEAEEWNNKSQVTIPNLLSITSQFSLMIIARCGFGIPISWSTKSVSSRKIESQTPSQSEISYDEAIHTACSTNVVRLLLPNWAFHLPIKTLKHIDRCWAQFTAITQQYIHDARAALNQNESIVQDGSGGILKKLVESSNEGNGKYSLNEKEMVANMFTLMAAGHETVASVLAATVTLLSIHKEEQNKAYKEVTEYIANNGHLNIDDPFELPHLLSCFLEANRMYPAAFVLARVLAEDTPVKIKHPKEETIVLPKGSQITFELVGTSYNPHNFPNPSVFMPGRWHGMTEHDVLGFGVGPRACIGRKLAFIEAVTLLALLLRDWKLETVPELVLKESLRGGDHKEAGREYEEHVLGNAGPSGTAFAIKKAPVKLMVRDG